MVIKRTTSNLFEICLKKRESNGNKSPFKKKNIGTIDITTLFPAKMVAATGVDKVGWNQKIRLLEPAGTVGTGNSYW